MFLLTVVTTMLYTSLGCPPTKIVNNSGEAFNQKDLQTLEKTKKRCGQLYKTSPCTKVFIKKTPNDYRVICGRNE